MRKINSNGYGQKIIGCAAICLIVVPAICCFLCLVTKLAQFQFIAKVSLALGVVILLFLFVLLKVEFHQDKKLNQYYHANVEIRLPLKNGFFECQNCGNRQVKPEQKSCAVCGINFRNWSENNPDKDRQ